MNILAFLQNQWFKNPQRMEQIYARHGGGWDRRAELNGTYLFFRSLTGKRLCSAFGDELCDRIIWEEASPKMAGKSGGVFPADHAHIAGAVEHHKPGVILTFGRVATDGVRATMAERPELIASHVLRYAGPHPAARHATVPLELQAMAEAVRRAVAA